MQKRKLGRSGLETAPIVFGGNVFGWTVDEPTGFKLLDAFTGAGFNMIDTSNSYSRWVPGHVGGESETVIGNWLKSRGNRSKVVIATKVGWDMGDAGKGLARDYIVREVEGSLRRLRTDYIDLYQSHVDDASTPLEETLEAYATLVKAGKVRAIGASNHSAKRLKEALETSKRLGLPRYETLQPLYNLYDRVDYEAELRGLCASEGIGVINFYALASGFLTGKYRNDDDVAKAARSRTNKKYMNERGLRILKALDEVSARLGTTQASAAIAWLIAQPTITAPIASATSLSQLDALIAAASLKLDAEAMAALDAASA